MKQQRPFNKGDRVTFKDGTLGFLVTIPEAGAMGWTVFQPYNGKQFTVSVPNDVKHTK